MKVFGLCGVSGSGKGAVSTCFLRRGIPSVDTDAVYHDITSKPSPCLDELAKRYGKTIISESGALRRDVLGEIVFADGAALSDLNAITHKYILAEARKVIKEKGELGIPFILIDAPLLFESGFDRECDGVIAVVADLDLRIARICERDGITEEAARRRISRQTSDDFLVSHADYVIENNGTPAELEVRVLEVYADIMKNIF